MKIFTFFFIGRPVAMEIIHPIPQATFIRGFNRVQRYITRSNSEVLFEQTFQPNVLMFRIKSATLFYFPYLTDRKKLNIIRLRI